ncbi:ADP-ribosylglycohydrolase [Parabacteroides sp. PFB2-10]|uniref:ADP-ribosylglycohydrolase family protein n=1 Tax=Parabacteroides sp. PFB2-10 TaxID=1742405 RepID=UPI0024750D24|nr:ADP-ribosylglycohydrolase family protein [Parabacteroides sp. PFB2-10]MDH6313120.1 ADP-ribosylglycohydrolase [Parabacteroides sp. PFB2-10]
MKNENSKREKLREILKPRGIFSAKIFEDVCVCLGLPEYHQMVPHLHFMHSSWTGWIHEKEMDSCIDDLLKLATDYFSDISKPPIQILKEAVENQTDLRIVFPKLSILTHCYPILLYEELLLTQKETPEDILAEFIAIRDHDLYNDLGKLGNVIEYKYCLIKFSMEYSEEEQLHILKRYNLKYLDWYINYTIKCREEARAYIEKDRKQKYLGCFIGGGVGDALGAPVEFMSFDEIDIKYGDEIDDDYDRETPLADYVEYPGNVGEFTDDTQMTLFTAEGLLRTKMCKSVIGSSWLPAIVHRSYLRWLKTQSIESEYFLDKDTLENGWLYQQKELFKQRAPGHSCLSALQSNKRGSTLEPINNSKGCGGIMRMAPVGLAYPPKEAFDIGCELAAITHGHPTGYLAAGYFAALISFLTNGTGLEEAIKETNIILKTKANHQELLRAIEKAIDCLGSQAHRSILDDHSTNIEEKLGGGWVAEEALAISLYCAIYFKDDFVGGVLAAVNHTGDSDSTGAITGNILGVIHGVKGIPEKWIMNLRFAHILQEVADDFYECMNGSMNAPESIWWEKYPGYTWKNKPIKSLSDGYELEGFEVNQDYIHPRWTDVPSIRIISQQ